MKAPVLLATTSHSLLRIDPESGAFEPLHRGLGLYFGITTDGERCFVAARGRMVSSEVPLEEERGRILLFDRALRPTGEIHAPFPMRDLHEILWHEGRLWITCSFDNMVAVHDLGTGSWEQWYPLGPTAGPLLDVNHFNSFAVFGGKLWVMAHNRENPPSELLGFDLDTRELLVRKPFGKQSHNIVLVDAAVLTCSSAEGTLIRDDGWQLATGGFPRGIAMGPGETYVGISEIAERKERDLSDGAILVYDPQWQPMRTIELPGEGLVLDLKLVEDAR